MAWPDPVVSPRLPKLESSIYQDVYWIQFHFPCIPCPSHVPISRTGNKHDLKLQPFRHWQLVACANEIASVHYSPRQVLILLAFLLTYMSIHAALSCKRPRHLDLESDNGGAGGLTQSAGFNTGGEFKVPRYSLLTFPCRKIVTCSLTESSASEQRVLGTSQLSTCAADESYSRTIASPIQQRRTIYV